MRKLLASILKKITSKTENIKPQITHSEVIKEMDKTKPRTKKDPKQSKSNGNISLSSDFPKDVLYSLSPQKMKLISAAEEIGLDPMNTESAFIARQLVQATLPHKNPGNIPAWSRTNGNLTLTIRPGWDDKKKKLIGYPYGTVPRLLLFWITTEAIRTKSSRLELGNSLSQFMEELGLDPKGTGKRSDLKRLKEQMIRLSRSTISFSQSSTRGSNPKPPEFPKRIN